MKKRRRVRCIWPPDRQPYKETVSIEGGEITMDALFAFSD
jgi:hypothetical protein